MDCKLYVAKSYGRYIFVSSNYVEANVGDHIVVDESTDEPGDYAVYSVSGIVRTREAYMSDFLNNGKRFIAVCNIEEQVEEHEDSIF